VQSFFADGGAALHTRSAKYCRLARGQLLCVPPSLVRRMKQHFCSLPELGVDLVVGCNGWLWLRAAAAPAQAAEQGAAAQQAAAAARPEEAPDAWEADAGAPVSAEERECICLAAAAVRCLVAMQRVVRPTAIVSVARAAIAWGVLPRDMTAPAFLQRLEESRRDECNRMH
jgi:exosome complex component RRP4